MYVCMYVWKQLLIRQYDNQMIKLHLSIISVVYFVPGRSQA